MLTLEMWRSVHSDVLWGPETRAGQAWPDVSMSYNCPESALHRRDVCEQYSQDPHELPIFLFDIRLKSRQKWTGGEGCVRPYFSFTALY